MLYDFCINTKQKKKQSVAYLWQGIIHSSSAKQDRLMTGE